MRQEMDSSEEALTDHRKSAANLRHDRKGPQSHSRRWAEKSTPWASAGNINFGGHALSTPDLVLCG